ncbi:NCL [Symbiodinium sp. KB8]|nr:NCL [Symbiodinium sp. KB8]
MLRKFAAEVPPTTGTVPHWLPRATANKFNLRRTIYQKVEVLRQIHVRSPPPAAVSSTAMKQMKVLVLAVTVLGAGATKIRSRANESSQVTCTPVQSELTKEVTLALCGKLINNKVNRGPDTKACFDADTPHVRKALANNMFKHCGAWHLYDFRASSSICWSWTAKGKCFKRSGACKSHKEAASVAERRNKLCKAKCLPAQPSLTEKVTKSYCSELVVNNANYGPEAVACEDEDTVMVRKSIANKMFHHCGAHYLYDFDNPAGTCYAWSKNCWKRETSCMGHIEQRRMVARKANLCEVPLVAVRGQRCKATPYTYKPASSCDGWSGLTQDQCTARCSSHAQAKNCPRKTCRAAVFYPKTGWCHLVDSCPEVEPNDDATASVHEVPMKAIEGAKCSSRYYTFDNADQSNLCDGWSGLTVAECALKCSGNEQATNCPQKTCVAATFYEKTGWCHLHDTCPDLNNNPAATAIVPEAARWCKGGGTKKAWSCDAISDSTECENSYTRSGDGKHFVQCAVTASGQCLAAGGLCKPVNSKNEGCGSVTGSSGLGIGWNSISAMKEGILTNPGQRKYKLQNVPSVLDGGMYSGTKTWPKAGTWTISYKAPVTLYVWVMKDKYNAGVDAALSGDGWEKVDAAGFKRSDNHALNVWKRSFTSGSQYEIKTTGLMVGGVVSNGCEAPRSTKHSQPSSCGSSCRTRQAAMPEPLFATAAADQAAGDPLNPFPLPENCNMAQIVFLTVMYGYVLFQASNLISDGSELLLLVPAAAPVVGSVVLPILGAVPDGMMVLFSGLGPDAQNQVSVGVGALAGSTVMLLTLPWFLAVLAGRVSLKDGKPTYQRPSGADPTTWEKLSPPGDMSLLHTGVGYGPEIIQNAYTMLYTMFGYIIIQGSAFLVDKMPKPLDNPAKGAKMQRHEAEYENIFALLGLFVCAGFFLWYLWKMWKESQGGGGAISDAIAESTIQAMRDGTLTLRGAMASFRDKQWSNMCKKGDLTEVLLNKESMDEVRRMCKVLAPFFAMYDANGDNAIDFEEFRMIFKEAC